MASEVQQQGLSSFAAFVTERPDVVRHVPAVS